ncbi:unnamed protein product [Miscanthus lutarioriparius]|uniref:Ionotropic glutamate receptor C-terminal domain-containing protein n=1 Tax=Miscanthus lutarioriparius TaxID=422564 RepID=A0A811SLT3_9POAL|nr:unnamed protein product [Miscanthus lutarioriparius]
MAIEARRDLWLGFHATERRDGADGAGPASASSPPARTCSRRAQDGGVLDHKDRDLTEFAADSGEGLKKVNFRRGRIDMRIPDGWAFSPVEAALVIAVPDGGGGLHHAVHRIGWSMVVAVQAQEATCMFFFLKPLTPGLWLASLAAFIFTGFVIWVIEHRINPEFRGTPLQQFGIIFHYAFSTLIFAHRENVVSNLSKFLMVIWVFAVLILTSSYTASLTSMLTHFKF